MPNWLTLSTELCVPYASAGLIVIVTVSQASKPSGPPSAGSNLSLAVCRLTQVPVGLNRAWAESVQIMMGIDTWLILSRSERSRVGMLASGKCLKLRQDFAQG